MMMKKVLIVDDDSINCMLAKHALVEDYDVATVNSGREALDFLKKEIPDLVLMDIEMPEMDGKTVVRKIKSYEKWSKIPVIFLTADTSPITEADCLQCGADDFITKPFVVDVMRRRVAKVMETHEVRKDLEQALDKETIKSYTDSLTGLKNRNWLETELKRLLGTGHGGTLFLTDLDNFKAMNDTHGHMTGDEVLKKFADALKQYSKEDDILCRLGGDEFVAFFTDVTEKKEASHIAEGIIKTFSDMMGTMGYAGVVSVSIGGRITTGDETFETLYADADDSLYFVKENGKNSYHFWSEQGAIVDSEIKRINTDADLEGIHRMISEEQDSEKGAFHVEYDDFKKLYDFSMRSVARNGRNVQVLLFTLRLSGKQTDMMPDEIMDILKQTVISSLRSVDTGTKYSYSQYIVLLMDTDEENGKIAADRVIEKFYQNPQIVQTETKVTYDICSLTSD